MTSLYKGLKPKEATENNRIKNIIVNISDIDRDIIDHVLTYYENNCFSIEDMKKFKYVDNPNVDDVGKHENGYMIIYDTSKPKSPRYLWEYFINWNNLRKIKDNVQAI